MNEVAKERCMEVYKEEKKKIKMSIYRSKKEVESCSRIKDGKGKQALGG